MAKNKEFENLKVGDIIIMDYGGDPTQFYTIERTKQSILVCMNEWLISSAIWFREESYLERRGEKIREGKFNIWSKMPIFGQFYPRYK